MWRASANDCFCRSRSSHRRCSIKKAVLKNFAIFTVKHLCWGLFLITFIKKDFNTGISWEYCGTFKNTYFEEHLLTTASIDRKKVGKVGYSTKIKSHWQVFWKFVVLKIEISILLEIPKFYYAISQTVALNVKWTKDLGFELFKLTFFKVIFQFYRYTNADLKICWHFRLYIKMMYPRYHIITPFTLWDMHARDI